jgi:hypothetical protein
MTRFVPKLCAMAAVMALAAGMTGAAVAQQPTGPSAQTSAPGPGGNPQPGVETEAAGPSGATRPSLVMPLLYVTSVEVLTSSADPKLYLVRVTGLASSPGWSTPELVPFYYGKSADNMLDLQFIATSPEQSQKADGFQPISAIFTLEASDPYKGVRVRAGANALEIGKMSGTAQTQIKASDGKDLVGKKYVEKGPGGASVVTDADLPRGFRTIAPTHGVAGITHNPNRLNLILDDKSMIVMAFWE